MSGISSPTISGSTNALTDSSGNVTSSASYDSFGNAGNLATRYKFTGREYDDFTGLHYYRARWYDGNLGRFISEDPIGFAGGDVNLYGYVHSNSINKNDPLGLVDLGYGSPTGPPIPYSNLERSAVTSYPFSYDFGCDRSGIGVGAINDFIKTTPT
ncbi:MAG: RHS repeat-associated core domain-containing protein [Acidobacteria bacterium]|nr:RHS repeat-associated core domain-containing protein [Acidobacteriota bacterium]